MDYALKINQNSLFSGNKTDPLEIAAQGSSAVQIPISLKYEDIYKAVTDLAGKKNSTYTFDGGLSFNLPVLGNVRLPVSKTGEIPLIKLPKVKVKNINLQSLSWSGASLNMDIAVIGSGGMDLLLDNLSYGLNISGKNWVNGSINNPQKLNADGESIISVPFKLDFMKMGRAAYDIVTGDAQLDYRFTGDMKVSADHPLLKATSFSFEDLSKIKIGK
jgi:LEA14-like dessication related protein